jgi:Holliday junction resolvase
MAATRAQKTLGGRKNYGRNYERGRAGERRAAAALRRAGYSVSISPGSAGFSDIVAKKNGKIRRIQVKTFSSRRFLTKEAAEKRIRGKPFNVRIPAGGEVWVYDADGRRYIIRGRS